jgi:very-short-patch-repair endonuclease
MRKYIQNVLEIFMRKLTVEARNLRQNQTLAEQCLWRHIRGKKLNGYKFRRQHIFGNYIVDFVCIELMLIVELDGKNHKQQIEYDNVRTAYLNSIGYKVIRFSNQDVLNYPSMVLQEITRLLFPSSQSSALGGGARGGGKKAKG